MIQCLGQAGLPDCLRCIPDPPSQLYVRGQASDAFARLLVRPRVAIVGSRRVSAYGRGITATLASELAARGVVIVSGLAIGVDAVAHRAALDAGGLTLAVLPGPVETIYPPAHTALAGRIVDGGGVLLSEYPAGMPALKHQFIARNRLVAGLADALLITEAAERSGTLHTARFALEQGIDVLAVPGNITSPTSAGTNNLLKSGAAPVTSAEDILHVLGIAPRQAAGAGNRPHASNEHEQAILGLLAEGTADGADLQRRSGLAVDVFSHHLTMLEITGKVRPLGANQWGLR